MLSAVTLTVDLQSRRTAEYTCDCCRAPIQRTWATLDKDDALYAAYFANCYHHLDQPHDVWIDVVLGSWQDPFIDHVTFGCRVGPIEGQTEPGATLLQACSDGSASRIHGSVLSREQGLAHAQLPEFWTVVDFVLAHDPTVHTHLYQR
jgi:hypothetical protein